MTLLLGIETSCDETAAAVVEDGLRVRSNVIASQHELHRRYGGVVPEIASRAHLERICPVIEEAAAVAGVELRDVDAVAVGNRPGLIGSLLVGVSAAKALAWGLGKPLIGIDHVRAHLYAGLMGAAEPGGGDINRSVFFPALGLVVSGGHTSLYALESPMAMTLLGRTIDDAVGEAYDKAAVILELGYPGGPRLDEAAAGALAAGYRPEQGVLPRSLLGKESLDFSFSGLKTALLYKVRGLPVGRGQRARFERTASDLSAEERAGLAAEFQEAAVDALMIKLDRAVGAMVYKGNRPRSLMVGGGVSANSLLRKRVGEIGERHGMRVLLPGMDLCLDNAAMIAGLGYEYLKVGQVDGYDLAAIATMSV